MNFNGLQVGDPVICHHERGTVSALCEWSDGRLIEVAMPHGQVCVSASEVARAHPGGRDTGFAMLTAARHHLLEHNCRKAATLLRHFLAPDLVQSARQAEFGRRDTALGYLDGHCRGAYGRIPVN